ncbi:catalytic protein [Cadophora sp. DSE1049]|nr:catalytic protein [Cadophora sp. DSE1049]
MATTQEKPTIVIIQGSFQTPLVYTPLRQLLACHGYPTTHPPLPSTANPSSPEFPKTSLKDDASATTEHLRILIEDEHKLVVVAMHSYGGMVGSEAVIPSLTHSNRQSQGLQGGVIHLFYYASFFLPPGQSMLSAMGESPLNRIDSNGRSHFLNGAEKLYNDLPAEEAKMWESRLIPAPYEIQKTVVSRAAWQDVESTFLICERDASVPEAVQKQFAEMAGSSVVRCSAGHSPMLSQVEVLVEKIKEAAESAVKKIG